MSYEVWLSSSYCISVMKLRVCTHKFPDWPPGARTANCTALCHYIQLYRYFVSQSSEFFRHNPLCFFSTSVCCCKLVFRYDSVRKILVTPSYTVSSFAFDMSLYLFSSVPD
jgi:hypothetical protein